MVLAYKLIKYLQSLNTMKTRLLFPKIVVAFALMSVFQSCNKTKDDPVIPKPVISIEDLIVSDNFNYQMVQSFNMRIVTKDIYDNPIANAIVYVYRSFDEESYEGDLMLTGKTNFEGVWETTYPLDFLAIH